LAQKFIFDPKDVEFSPNWFRAFYLIIHNRPPPPHTEEWIDKIFEAYEKNRGIVIEAFRGSTKTTTVTQTLTAFFIGCFPHLSNLLIQVGDDIAKDNTSAIDRTISYNPGWAAFFPDVAPNKPEGWGDKGYNVIDNALGPEEWARARSDDKDPTFIGVGRTAKYIGKHPTGLLILDDIDDELYTSSDRERSKTKKLLTGTIFPAAGKNARLIIVIGTPWVENDTLSYVKSTGEFDIVRTPVVDEDGPVWPEKFDDAEINRQRNLAGSVEFARMYLLDLEQAKGHTLRREWLHDYPADKIDPTWPVVMGVDYASTEDKLRDRDRDYFALAVGRLLPGGGVVLVDGFRGHVSQGEALQTVQRWAASHPTLTLIAVEKEGIGGQFFETLKYQTGLYIHPATTADKITPSTPSARNKGERFQHQMAPHFEMSRVWVSNQSSLFLKIFRDEWVSWPLGEHDDTLDATYYMLYAAMLQGALVIPMQHMHKVYVDDWTIPKVKQENPWKAFLRS